MTRALSSTITLMVLIVAACQSRDTSSSAAGDSAAAQVGSAGVEDSVRALEQQWADAVRTRDSVTLDRLVAADFSVSSQATTDPPVPRAVWMTNTLHNLRVDSIRLSPAQVVVKSDTATATLDFFWVGQFMSTPPFRDSTTLTDTWVRGPQGWQVHRRVLAR